MIHANRPRRPIPNRGFTLIELLVTLGVATVIMAVVVAQDRAHTQRLVYDDIAYRLALAVRQAQSYGISAKEYVLPGAATRSFRAGYGVHFTDESNVYSTYSSVPTGTEGNHYYETTETTVDTDRLLETKTLPKGTVTQLCTNVGLGSVNCSYASLDIEFQRPNPEPWFRGSDTYESASVTITFPDGTSRTVIARRTGQISIQ